LRKKLASGRARNEKRCEQPPADEKKGARKQVQRADVSQAQLRQESFPDWPVLGVSKERYSLRGVEVHTYEEGGGRSSVD